MPHQVVQNSHVNGFQIFVDMRSTFGRIGVGFSLLLHGKFVLDVPDWGKGYAIHITKLVALTITFLNHISDVQRNYLFPDLFCSFDSFSQPCFQALLDRKGYLAKIAADAGCHTVVVMHTKYIGIIPADCLILGVFSLLWIFNFVNQRFEFRPDFLYGFVFYMTLDNVLGMSLFVLAPWYEFQFEPQEL